MRKRYNNIIVIFFLSIQAVLLLWCDHKNSLNQTETGHLGAAAYLYKTFRFDVFHVNTPLTRVIIGLPIVLSGSECDCQSYLPQSQSRSEWLLGISFVHTNSSEKIYCSVFFARVLLIPFIFLGGYCGYRISLSLSGYAAAYTFLIIWTFSPFILAWSATICPDAVASSVGIIGIYTFWLCLNRPTWENVIVAGYCLGLLVLTKLTWIIAFSLWGVIWYVWKSSYFHKSKKQEKKQSAPDYKKFGVILLVAVCMINIGYAFDGSFRLLRDYKFTSHLLTGKKLDENKDVVLIGNRFANSWLGYVPIFLPAEFVQGIDTQKLDFERGLPSYVRGQHADHGWWYYYLYALVVKMPFGTWGLLGLAVVCTVFLKGYNAPWRDEMVIWLPGLALFIFVSSQTGFSVHSRYIIPALPFLFIWISKVGRAFSKEQLALYPRSTKVVRGLTVFFLGWMVISSLWIYPHSLSYFNELAAVLPTPEDENYPEQIVKKADVSGSLFMAPFKILDAFFTAGPKNGPRHLLDSNIDWGQDLFYLEDCYEAHPEARPFHVAYWGSYPLDLSKIESAGYPPIGPDAESIDENTDPMTVGPLPGYYALSVNEIYGRSKQYRYFLHFEPVAMAGYSIYIYHITLDEANLVREKLGLPKLGKDWNEHGKG